MDRIHLIRQRVHPTFVSDCVPAGRASTMVSMPRARVPDEDAARFGAIVTRLRMERGWTIADLSRLSCLNATWLGVLERGGNVPSLATIFKLSEVFGVEAAELVREIEQSRRREHTPASE
jgi:ribosome-binding protein aMBF1 (putative translation factor)